MSRSTVLREDFSRLSVQRLTWLAHSGASLFAGLSFELDRGECLWLNGPTGSGKSLLCRILAGLVPPPPECVWINDKDLALMSFEEFLPINLNIGFGFDFGGLLHNKSIYENLELPLSYHQLFPAAEIPERIARVVELMDLESCVSERPSHVTGGQRKAACLARALVMEPELLILDDPTAGLNQRTAAKLWERLLDLKACGQSLVLASDQVDFCRRLADQELDLSKVATFQVGPSHAA